jgi:hypothetical protein
MLTPAVITLERGGEKPLGRLLHGGRGADWEMLKITFFLAVWEI